ncbi:MAG: extradiol ring-cleavage dioxygenase, partial [Dehalococcoidia bacterium]
MAKVVLGIGTSHSPMLSTTPDVWPKHVERDLVNAELWAWDGKPHRYDELVEMSRPELEKEITLDRWWERYNACQDAIAKVGEIVADVNPDVLVIVGDDQKEVLHEDNMPAMMVYWGDTVLNKPRDRSRLPESIALAAWANEFEEGPREFPSESGLGLHIIKSLIHEEFDVAHSKVLPNEKGEGHAFGFVHRRILNGRPVPIVPIMQNTYYPPNQPTPKRCFDFGQAVRRAIDSWDSDARVAVVASGGLSHFVIDENLDRGVLRAMQEKNSEHLRTVPENLLNSGNSEIRNWIATAGAVEDLDMKLIDYVPCYR